MDSMGEPNAGAVLRVAVAITTFGPGVDAPGEVDVSTTHELTGSCGRVCGVDR